MNGDNELTLISKLHSQEEAHTVAFLNATSSMEFKGHLAFVTGGASGIGEQVCRDLAAEGASVVVADVQSKAAVDLAAALPKGDGRVHLGLELDVSKKSEVESALAQIIKTYRRPADLIVNAAGVPSQGFPLEDIPEEVLDRVMAVNFKGTFLVTQVFGKALLDAKKPGSIVNISSILAYMIMPVHTADYSASKAAVMQFSKVSAKEWGPKGIRVNSVHPGVIDTPMGRTLKDTPVWPGYMDKSGLRRIGVPKDVSNVVLFALSNKSAFVTGAQLEVSGQAAW